MLNITWHEYTLPYHDTVVFRATSLTTLASLLFTYCEIPFVFLVVCRTLAVAFVLANLFSSPSEPRVIHTKELTCDSFSLVVLTCTVMIFYQ